MRLWAGGLLCGLLVTAAAAPGVAAVDDPTPQPMFEQGRLLPQRWLGMDRVDRRIGLVSASERYVAHDYYDRAEGEEKGLRLHRVGDGSLVRTVQSPYAGSSYAPYMMPKLVGDSWLQPMLAPTGSRVDRIAVRDVETGTLTAELPIPVGEEMLAVGEDWILTSGPGGTWDRPLHLYRPDGLDQRWPDVQVGTNNTSTKVLNDHTVLVHDQDSVTWKLDVAKGYHTPAGYEMPDVITAGRLFWVETVYQDGQSVNRLSWSDHDGSNAGSVVVAAGWWERDFLPFGDRVALLHVPDGGDAYNKALSPVDLSTGELEPPVATHVAGARPMGDGRLALSVADGATGRVAVVGDGSGEHTVMPFPAVPQQVGSLRLSHGVAATTWSAETSPVGAEPGQVWFTDAEGSDDDWRPGYLGGPVATDSEGNALDYAGNIALTALPRTGSSGAYPYRLTWPGGSRDVTGAFGTIRLGNGGLLLARGLLSASGGSVSGWQVEDARTGEVKATFPGSNPHLGMDGTWIWQGPTAQGTMTGTDTANPGTTRTVQTGLTCPATPTVMGRWALVPCNVDQTYVVDLRGVVDPWRVPYQEHDRPVALGGGFVAWVTYRDLPTGDDTPLLQVADLSEQHSTRTYGPVRGRTFPPGPSYAPDDAGAPQLVYADDHSQARVLDLDWLGAAPWTREDRTAPRLDALTGSPRYLAATGDTTAVTFGWQFSDPDSDIEPASGVDTVDVRYRQSPAPGQPYGPWVEPPALQATTRTEATVEAAAGADSCWLVRARDLNGNVSAWSTERCTLVDDDTPVLTSVTGGPRILPEAWLSTVRFSYRATDALGVAGYEASYRQAPAGGALSPWATPSGWQDTTATSVQRRVAPGGEVCFRVRARDAAGHVSAWSTPRCSAVPYDDRDLLPRGAISTIHTGAAMGDSESLLRSGASLRLGRLTGKSIAVLTARGPKEGVLEVYVDDRRLGRVNLNAAQFRRSTVTIDAPRSWTGAVRLVSAASSAVRVDGMAVLR